MNAITAQMATPSPDSKDASNQLAIFREEKARSDYRTAGEAGAARENSLQARIRRGTPNPLQALMNPEAGGLQTPV